jgi:peptide deformylase
VLHPDPVLRRRAEPIGEVDERIRDLAEQMIRIMHEADGYGLAAPQVGESLRMFVTQREGDDEGDGGIVYINPRLVRVEGTLEAQEERCLSLPTIRGTVRRQPIVEIEATDLEGRVFRMESSDVMARCWQHEMDHLDGVLIIDRMSSMDRLVNRKKLRALEERE